MDGVGFFYSDSSSRMHRGFVELIADKTVSEFVDGLDSLYKEARNRRILIPSGMMYVSVRINGATDEQLREYLRKLRQAAAGE